MMVREASYSQAEAVYELHEQARAVYRRALIDKWSDGHPDFDDVFGDIDDGICYTVEENRVIAAFVLDFSGDTSYRAGGGCSWPAGEYAVLHHMSVSADCDLAEVIDAVVDFCTRRCAENGVDSIRCGAHPKELAVCDALIKCGFENCGRFRTPTGEERSAYCKVINGEE